MHSMRRLRCLLYLHKKQQKNILFVRSFYVNLPLLGEKVAGIDCNGPICHSKCTFLKESYLKDDFILCNFLLGF